MSASINPYAPPKAHVDDVTQSNTQAEAIRREHIKHETSVRSIGLLYYFSGAMLCIAMIALIAVSFKGVQVLSGMILGPIYLTLGVLSILVARGLRNLRPWARTTTLVLSCIGLLGFPAGTLINSYILYLLLSKKGRRIFEEDYPAIVAATPDMKYRTSMVTWIVLGILILLVVGAIAMAVFSK